MKPRGSTDPRSSNLGRRLNLPPSYVLIHRVSTEGIGVLCQLESEGPFRAEMIQWMPGYRREGNPPLDAGDDPDAGSAESSEEALTPAPRASPVPSPWPRGLASPPPICGVTVSPASGNTWGRPIPAAPTPPPDGSQDESQGISPNP